MALGGLFGQPRKYELSTELFSLTPEEVEMDLWLLLVKI